MSWALLAVFLWLAMATGLGLGIWSLVSKSPNVALTAGAMACAVIIAFSWVAALSIGPFTIALAVVLTALVTTRGLSWWARIVALVAGLTIYYLAVWAIPPIQPASALVLPTLCGLAFAVAALSRFRHVGTQPGALAGH
jgi:hypothetical protein